MFKQDARLNLHGVKQEYTNNFFDTFSPVVTWFTTRLVLSLYIIIGWKTCQVDFVLAFNQSNIEFDMYMEITQIIETKGGSRTMHILKLVKDIYGQRQGYRVWNQNLTKGIEEIGLRQHRVDDCMLYQCEVIFIVYVDSGIFSSPSDAETNQTITEISAKFGIEDQWNLDDYTRVNMDSPPQWGYLYF